MSLACRALLTALVLSSAALAADPKPKPEDRSIAGVWEGPLKAGPVELRLAFKLKRNADNTYAGTLDSIDQGVKDIPFSSVTFAGGKLTAEADKLKASFTGTLSADGSAIKGEWKQSGTTFPLELKRVEKISELRRPQTPKPPFPYRSEEVVVENKPAGMKLAGTLTLPKGDGPFPAVITITGSGPQDRDETLLGHKPFAVLADHLTRRGIAVLRCDDRGTGKSTGDHAKATSADFATDVAAQVAYMKGRKEIDPKRIGLVGHSEGGLIAPMAAAEHPNDVGFIVLLAGPGIPGDELMLLQGEAVLRVLGVDEKLAGWQRELQKELFAIARKGGEAAEVKKALRAALDAAEKKLPEEQRKKMGKSLSAQLESAPDRLATPWFRYFLAYDPRPALRKVRCPVLALNGEKDVQVPPKVNLSAIAAALKEGGNGDVTTKELPGLNHLFQTCKTGSPTEYATIEETFAPAALDLIADWILARK